MSTGSTPTPADAAATAEATADAPAKAAKAGPNADTPAAATATASAGSGPQPGFARRATAASRPWHWLLIASLLLLLALQVVLAERVRLAADPAWRPLLQGLCSVLPCELPPWRQPQALRMLEREVRADPARPGLLRIHARFRNDARWPQAWPRLQVSLSDADGRRLAARVLEPEQYLGHAPEPDERLAPGQEAAITFEVREPPGGVVAYDFSFR